MPTRCVKKCVSRFLRTMRKHWRTWGFSEAERSIQQLGTGVNGQKGTNNGQRPRARTWRAEKNAVWPCIGSFTASDRIPGRAARRDLYRCDPRLRRTQLGNRKTPRGRGKVYG